MNIGNSTLRLPSVALAAVTALTLAACTPAEASPDTPSTPDPTPSSSPSPSASPAPTPLPSPSPDPSPSATPVERQATAQVDLLDQTVTEIGPANDPSGTQLLNTVFQTEFTGDLAGSGYHVYLDTIDADGYATSEGAGRFVGSLDGVSGTFLMQASGTAAPDGSIAASWCVVEGSASGDLEGLSGCGEINTTGTPVAQVTLNYTLP
ncbi:DUF3224 domain-containing protein [Nocardiopsis dassonvillei]|uniref:DUF3224 domain-containing protein n=1 Tax=Nocardiopsis dassonvillei TaxID=2014 RepID=UPI0036FE786A